MLQMIKFNAFSSDPSQHVNTTVSRDTPVTSRVTLKPDTTFLKKLTPLALACEGDTPGECYGVLGYVTVEVCCYISRLTRTGGWEMKSDVFNIFHAVMKDCIRDSRFKVYL